MTNIADIDLLAAYYTLAGDVYPFSPAGVISPFSFRDRVEVAAKHGWRGIGLLLADAQATAAKIGTAEMKRILDANGMRHFEIELLIDWYIGGERRAKSDKMRHEILEMAQALGARAVKISPGRGVDPTNPRPEELKPDVPPMIEGFIELCRDAAAHGTSIVMEITPFSNASTIAVGRAIVEGADQLNGGLLLDIWHVARGGNPYSEIAKIPARFIGAVELDDADSDLKGHSIWEDTILHRKLPGYGDLRVPEFIKAVQGAGYRGPWGVEILSETHRKLSLDEMARRAFHATMKQFEE